MTFITSLRRWDRKTFYSHLPTFLLILLFLTFFVITTYIALHLDYGIVPDERVHIAFSKLFATTWGIPAETPDVYEYGLTRYRPFLFYWINGRAINFLSLFISQPTETITVIALRMINVFYSIISLWLVYLLAGEVIKNRWWKLLVIFLLTHTLMYTFLAAGVSYDNLSNMLSVASIYFLVKVIKNQPYFTNTVAIFICITTGSLVKVTILPIAVVVALLWLIYTVKNRKVISFRPVFDAKTIILITIALTFIVMNLVLYGYNLIVFQRVLPGCEQYLPISACRMSAIFERDVTRKPPIPIKLEDILEARVPDVTKWLHDYWMRRMSSTIFGVYGHKIYSTSLLIVYYELFFLVTAFLAARYWKKPPSTVITLGLVSVFYTLILIATHYSNEIGSRFAHYGIQGRYIFPVIGVMYILVVYFISNVSSKIIRNIIIVYTLVLYSYGGPALTLILDKNLQFPTGAIGANILSSEIVGGYEVYQTFISECKGSITRVDLFVDANGRVNTYPIIFQLIDRDTNQLLAEQQAPGEEILDYTWRYFPIPPVPETYGKNLQIILLSPESVPGNAISIWISRSNNYLNGEALINSIPQKGDLRFRYVCRQPVLANWFHE